MKTLEQQVRELADREEIKELTAKYAHWVALGEGAKVADWWAAHDIESIRKYCREDVRIAYRVFSRLTYQEPRQFSPDEDQAFKTSVVEATSDSVAEVRLT